MSKYDVVEACNGIIFIQNWMEICQLVKKFKQEGTQPDTMHACVATDAYPHMDMCTHTYHGDFLKPSLFP
jgi:hypothetical protein